MEKTTVFKQKSNFFNKLKKLGSNRGMQLLLLLGIYFSVASVLPNAIHQGLYTFSLLIKDILLWLLPLMVGFFIAHALSSFEKKAPLFILTLFVFEAVSNLLSVWYAYGSGFLAMKQMSTINAEPLADSFSPLWAISTLKPLWWSASKGTFAGILFGLVAAFKFPVLKSIISVGKAKIEWLLTRFFSRLIPLFILGFIARMYKTRLLDQLVGRYLELLLYLVLFLLVYLSFLFFLGSGFGMRKFFNNIKNVLPAGAMAFTSGCSLSTMPWTIEGTAKNLKDPELAKTVIPATTNIQQIGDCIANTFLCFLIYCQFYGHPPSLGIWLPFSLVFVLARFTTAAVIGGAIFIMLPIYEGYLGFNAEMIAIILAFNVILDPLITSSNVIANGALCRVFERVWIKMLGRFASSDVAVEKLK